MFKINFLILLFLTTESGSKNPLNPDPEAIKRPALRLGFENPSLSLQSHTGTLVYILISAGNHLGSIVLALWTRGAGCTQPRVN
jgi:hypothetical protein